VEGVTRRACAATDCSTLKAGSDVSRLSGSRRGSPVRQVMAATTGVSIVWPRRSTMPVSPEARRT
jgi:hypothetical protein